MSITLLLIHGFPQDHRIWDLNTDALGRYAKVLAPDLRGFGRHASRDTAVTMEAFAADLHALLHREGAERVVLCGLSMGGYIAMAFIERWPGSVDGLVLCNTRSTEDTAEGKIAREATAKDALEKGMGVIARGMLPKVLGAQTRRTRPELAARVESMMAEQDPGAVAAAARGMAMRPDRTGVLRTFRKPALVITGEEDALMPLPTSKAMVDALPNGSLHVLPKVGHLGNLESPQLFNQLVAGLLQQLQPG